MNLVLISFSSNSEATTAVPASAAFFQQFMIDAILIKLQASAISYIASNIVIDLCVDPG
jgi:hypothetical protein